MVDIVFEEFLKALWVFEGKNVVVGDFEHLDCGCMDGLLPCQKEEIKHLLAEVFGRIVVTHH